MWASFKNFIAKNKHDFINQQMYLAYESLSAFFLLSNAKFKNFQSKILYQEIGELLFYFDQRNIHKNKSMCPSTGRNNINGAIERSKNKLYNHEYRSRELIPQNSFRSNRIIILN